MTTVDKFDETRVVQWIEAERKQTVTGLSVLPGATSSTIVEAALRSGERVVARLHTHDAFYREVPDRLIHEFAALEAVADLDLPTPKPLAYDEHACGVPAILMTHLVGDVDISVSRSAIRALATALHEIHGVQTAEFPWRPHRIRSSSAATM